MNRGFEELQSRGAFGIGAFWAQLLLIGLSISAAIFSIYWLAITGSHIWLKAVSGSILTANLFLLIFGLASTAFGVMSKLGINIINGEIPQQLFIAGSFLCQLMCCILMSLSRESKAAMYFKDIQDFCIRYPDNEHVKDFLKEYATEYSVQSYVAQRTTQAYNSIAAFFGIWVPTIIVHLFCCYKLDDTKDGEEAPLAPNSVNTENERPYSHQGEYNVMKERQQAQQFPAPEA